MSSGRDAVLVDYGGSGFLSLNGHTHAEGHQGVINGWYKSAHKPADGRPILPSLSLGIQVNYHGAPAEPTFYEQEFFPELATLVTVVDFRFGLRLRITSFITYGSSISCERVELIEAPEKTDLTIAFRAMEPWFPTRIGSFPDRPTASFTTASENLVEIDYKTYSFHGSGGILAYPTPDSVTEGKCASYCSYTDLIYTSPRKGEIYSRLAWLIGDNETYASTEELKSLASLGFDEIYSRHKSLWRGYFGTSSVELGDEKLDYLYRLSRYLVKAHQHPDSGIITLGMQPNHWGGAISCAWDAEFAHEALLTTSNLDESRKFTEQFYRQADIGYEVMKKCGYTGLGFTGWTTLSGEFCGHTTIEKWLTDFKPMFSAYAITSLYSQWRTDPHFDVAKYETIAKDVLAFWLSKLVYRGDDGLYYLHSVKDGAETGLDAEVDTFTQLIFAKSFLAVGEMFDDNKYSEIGRKMLLALECNRKSDGNLALFRGSEDVAGMLIHYSLIDSEGVIEPDLIIDEIERSATPFGMDNDICSEEYRHWPWYDSFSLRAAIRCAKPKLAFEKMAHLTSGCSALGALPEKIRLDGYPVGYYYTSPHALLVTSVAESFALRNREGVLKLGYGFLSNTSAKCSDIMTLGGIKVSLTIDDGRLSSLRLTNTSPSCADIPIDINPSLSTDDLPSQIHLLPDETYEYN